MSRATFVLVVVLGSSSAFAQDPMAGNWKQRVYMNSQDFYGNHCIARAQRGRYDHDTAIETADFTLTTNGNYINGTSGNTRVQGSRHANSVVFTAMNFTDTPEPIDVPGCGSWVLTGFSTAHMGVLNGRYISGTFVTALFLEDQEDNTSSLRIQGIFAMWKVD